MAERRKKSGTQPDFVSWGKSFFAYLEAHKKRNNPGLMELIYCLGDQGRQELALLIYNFLRSKFHKEFSKARQVFGQKVQRLLSRATRDLRRSVASLRKLQTLATDETGKTIAAGLDLELVALMEKEALRLSEQKPLARVVFSKKRFGLGQDLSILILLQEFVAEFGRRWNDYLPAHAIRYLRAVDIADLLEAGKAARAQAEEFTFTDPATIERALGRFRTRKANAHMRLLLKKEAIKRCDGLRLRPPSSAH